MKPNAWLGRNRDVTFNLHNVLTNAGTAGTGADYEVPLGVNPDLVQSHTPLLAQGVQPSRSALPVNAMGVRQSLLSSVQAVTAGATNNFDLRINVRRAGVLQGAIAYYSAAVTTTLGTAVTAGSLQTVTPAAMAGIHVGQQLNIDTAGSLEVVTVQATSATTFSAYFNILHAGAAAVTSSLVAHNPVTLIPAGGGVAPGAVLPVITAGAGVVFTPTAVNGISGMYGIHVGDQLLVTDAGLTETVTISAVTSTQATATFANSHTSGKGITTAVLANQQAGALFAIKGGDLLTLARVSNNATGLISPLTMLVELDWELSTSGMGQS